MKLPVTFTEFAKQPLKALLYLLLVVVAYLYVDLKASNIRENKEKDKINRELNQRIALLEVKVEFVTERLRQADSTASALNAQFKLLRELGKIN